MLNTSPETCTYQKILIVAVIADAKSQFKVTETDADYKWSEIEQSLQNNNLQMNPLLVIPLPARGRDRVFH